MVNYIGQQRGLVTGSTTQGLHPILAGRVVRDVAPEIALLDANNAPLMTLLMKLRKSKASQPKFEWQEDVFPAQATAIQTADASANDTTVVVTAGTGSYGRPGDLWWNVESDEIMYIQSVTTDTWTVIRGVGGTTPTINSVAQEIYYIGNAMPMGWTARAPLTTVISQPYNYCQLFKESFEVTGTLDATTLYGGADRSYLRRKHGDLHKRDIEKTFWFGDRDLIATDEAATYMATTYTGAYMTRGVTKWIETAPAGNVHSNDTILTEDEFCGYLQTDFRYGNGVKFMFCSPLALTVISSWGRDKLQVVPRDTTFGINITRYISPHGELNLINNKMLGDITDADDEAQNPSKSSYILDIEQLKYRYLRDTRLEMGIQENDRDSLQDQYMTECGLEFSLPKHHSVIWGWQL